MATKVNQKEYLRKYLSNDKKKKKNNKKHKRKVTLKIIDDDVVGHTNEYDYDEITLTGEDAPQIVGIYDELFQEKTIQNKWKQISNCKHQDKRDKEKSSESVDDIVFKKPADCSKHKLKNITRSIEQSPAREASASEGKGNSSSGYSRENTNDSDLSPHREYRSHKRENNVQKPSRCDSDDASSRKQSHKKHSSSHKKQGSLRSYSQAKSPDVDLDQSPPRKSSSNHVKRSRRSRSRGDSGRHDDLSPPKKHHHSKAKLERSSPHHHKRSINQSAPKIQSKYDTNDSPRLQEADYYRKERSPKRVSSSSSNRHLHNKNHRDHSKDSPVSIRRNYDQSPQRRPESQKGEGNREYTSPRKRSDCTSTRLDIKVESSSPDQSPVRRRDREDIDNLTVRVKREKRSESPERSHKSSRTLDGKHAGLQDAKALRRETAHHRQKENAEFNEMPEEISGRYAEVQVRQSSSYRRHHKHSHEDSESQRKRDEHEEQKKLQYSRWNRGVKQLEDQKAQASADQYEKSKPLARYSDDADLDQMLRQREHPDDPMLEYMRKKNKAKINDVVLEVPKYEGLFPDNRFSIPPGYRWDGVDRSNGYEKNWFEVRSGKQALAEEAYKYSTEDM